MTAIKARSNCQNVRNPVLALKSIKRLQKLPQRQRAALRALLRDLAKDARRRAEDCWKSHKPPMAAYWKAVSVYAGHTAKAIA
jgi:hypothetical protein